MSQAKLTLRPPPNVDFVQGYPGIPPGAPDRPQAAVKGTIELRVGPQGVKAKWVRIELRKVETLPGGGLQNTFFDFVGQSPINLWQSGEDYGILSTQDFPFYIRIPESIPPTMNLDRMAGIKYELIATVCVKEKKGFLRRDKSKVINASAPIVIDKHELHTTWPVYTQPDSRDMSQDGMTLTVERTHTCYGPGDRITVMATVKSDSLHTVILRGFEFSLKETVVFRAGPNTTGKKGAPQVKVGNVGEQKVPVNATIYGGGVHKAELSVAVPSSHTSATLNSARHIDITYVLTVKALLATGNHLIMDLPVIISNWPRSVSVEAVKRIGLASNVASHLAPNVTTGMPQIGRLVTQTNPTSAPPGSKAALIAATRQSGHPYSNPAPPPPTTITTITDSSSEPATDSSRPAGNYNTAPSANGYAAKLADEFGYNRAKGSGIEKYAPGAPQIQTISGLPSSPGRPLTADSSAARPRSAAGRQGAGTRTLSVVNYGDDMPEEIAAQNKAKAQATAARHQRNTSLNAKPTLPSTTPRTGWLPAEEEKKILYEQAKAQVELVQGVVASAPRSPPILSPQPIRDAGPILTANGSFSASTSKRAWPSAEEEKARLFHEARAKAAQTQGYDRMNDTASPSEQPAMSTGAAMYSKAMSSLNRNASASNSAAAQPTTPKKTAAFLSAEEEKAALARRFQEAKAAVERNQAVAFGSTSEGSAGTPPPIVTSPVSYDAPYSQTNGRVANSPPPSNDLTPGFDPVAIPPDFSQLSEKERLRRAFEARDRALAAQVASPATDSLSAPSYAEPTSSPPPPSSSYASTSALSEKERLRRHFEEQDAARKSGNPPVPPPRSVSGRSLPTLRAQPVPPGGASGGSSSRLLSAAEEKARLAAVYAAEDGAGSPPPFPTPQPYVNGVNGNRTNGNVQRQPSLSSVDYNSIPPPPPLLPRPPKEYIQETQEEDQTLAKKLEAIDSDEVGVDLTRKLDPTLELRPFTPFAADFDARRISQAVPPPPLPPKVPLIDS